MTLIRWTKAKDQSTGLQEIFSTETTSTERRSSKMQKLDGTITYVLRSITQRSRNHLRNQAWMMMLQKVLAKRIATGTMNIYGIAGDEGRNNGEEIKIWLQEAGITIRPPTFIERHNNSDPLAGKIDGTRW